MAMIPIAICEAKNGRPCHNDVSREIEIKETDIAFIHNVGELVNRRFDAEYSYKSGTRIYINPEFENSDRFPQDLVLGEECGLSFIHSPKPWLWVSAQFPASR